MKGAAQKTWKIKDKTGWMLFTDSDAAAEMGEKDNRVTVSIVSWTY